jgi:membrane protein YqaA with SNARE-associated domain
VLLPWLGIALGIAFGSAVVPFLSIELFVIGLAAQEPQISCLLLGAVVAVGQVGGKLLYYYAGRGSIHLPAFLHRAPREPKPPTARRARWQLRTKRVRAWVDGVRAKCERHPHWMVGTYAVSSVVGLPPYMATVVLAGLVRMRLSTFLGAGLAGRFIRFSLLAASPPLFAGWLF